LTKESCGALADDTGATAAAAAAAGAKGDVEGRQARLVLRLQVGAALSEQLHDAIASTDRRVQRGVAEPVRGIDRQAEIEQQCDGLKRALLGGHANSRTIATRRPE